MNRVRAELIRKINKHAKQYTEQIEEDIIRKINKHANKYTEQIEEDIIQLINNLSNCTENYFINATSYVKFTKKPFKNRILLFTTNDRKLANNIVHRLFTWRKSDKFMVNRVSIKKSVKTQLSVKTRLSVKKSRLILKNLYAIKNRLLIKQKSKSCFYVCLFYGKHDETSERSCPLPDFMWANNRAVWYNMVHREEEESPSRAFNVFNKQKHTTEQMKPILFNWLLDVCADKQYHRETYYLAIDYIDRYLTTQHHIASSRLQLVGITCLFIAVKVNI